MKALTYDQWKDAGYYVRKGQRSHTRNAKGEPTFTRDQVMFADEAPLRQYADDEERDFTDAAESMR